MRNNVKDLANAKYIVENMSFFEILNEITESVDWAKFVLAENQQNKNDIAAGYIMAVNILLYFLIDNISKNKDFNIDKITENAFSNLKQLKQQVDNKEIS